MTKQILGIIGAGAIGKAIGSVFERSGTKVLYWDAQPNLRTVDSLNALAQAPIVMICAPSQANADIASELSMVMSNQGQHLVISVAKGVAPGFITMDEVLDKACQGRCSVGLLYGPMLAQEVKTSGRAAGILGINDESWQDCFKPYGVSGLVVDYSADIRSVAYCGVLKNIYALSFGLCDGLGLGNNLKGRLLVKVVAEMKAVLKALGADPSMAEGLAGLGDLLATGWSELSFNYRIGKSLANQSNSQENTQGEGVNSLKIVPQKLEIAEYPILALLHSIATGGEPGKLEEYIVKT